MKKCAGLAISGIMFMVCSSFAQAGDFEGILHMKTTHSDTDSATTMDWYIKGEKARMEMLRGEGKRHFMIVDSQTRTMLMPMSDKKVYMELSLDQAGEKTQEHMKEALEKHTVERTGKVDKIAGYSCEVWRIKDKDTEKVEHEICVAKGFGKSATFWMDPKQMQRSSQPAWVKQLVNEGGFGLRTIRYDDDGKETSRTEVTSIEKKSLDKSLFTMPSDYTKVGGEAMMRGATGGAQGHGGEDFQKMMEEMKKRKTEQGGTAGGQGGPNQQPDANEMIRQLGEMMKKRQQGAQ